MMKYFAIEYSLDERLMGKIPQIKEFIRHCHVDDEPDFIDKFYFRKIDINPILSNVVLYANAKRTDVIHVGGIGFSFGSIVISDKLKRILEQFNCYGLQYFPTYVVQKDQKFNNYWQAHIYKLAFEYIDFDKTQIVLRDRDENRNVITKNLEVSGMGEFLNIAESMIYPKEIRLLDIHFNSSMDLDYFQLNYTYGGHKGIVSERLKKKIEEEGITGIEFRPIEMPLQDWYHSGEREKMYGKI